MRSGTENVPGIVGLAVACEKMIGKNYENAEKIRESKNIFRKGSKRLRISKTILEKHHTWQVSALRS